MVGQTSWNRVYAWCLFKIYLIVLGGLVLHVYTDEHHLLDSDHTCTTEVHYHQTNEDCSLTSHTLTPSLSNTPLCIEEPVVTFDELPFMSLVEGVARATYRYYHLRAPPFVA